MLPVNPLYPDYWSLEGANLCLEAFAPQGEAKNKPLVCPVEAGGHRDPGGQAASLGCGRLSGTLPFPASESEEGTQAGLQSCRFYQLLTREERRKSEYKQPPPTHPAQMQIFLFSIGGVLVGPNPHFLPASPQSPTAGPLGGDCVSPRTQQVTGTHASSHLCR